MISQFEETSPEDRFIENRKKSLKLARKSVNSVHRKMLAMGLPMEFHDNDDNDFDNNDNDNDIENIKIINNDNSSMTTNTLQTSDLQSYDPNLPNIDEFNPKITQDISIKNNEFNNEKENMNDIINIKDFENDNSLMHRQFDKALITWYYICSLLWLF